MQNKYLFRVQNSSRLSAVAGTLTTLAGYFSPKKHKISCLDRSTEIKVAVSWRKHFISDNKAATGLESATHWWLMRPKFHLWRLKLLVLRLSRQCGNFISALRWVTRRPTFSGIVSLQKIILEDLICFSNIQNKKRSQIAPIHSFCFAVKYFQFGKLANGRLYLKSPQNALQAYGYVMYAYALCPLKTHGREKNEPWQKKPTNSG